MDDSLLLQVSDNDLEDLLLQKEEKALINQAIESFGEIEREILCVIIFLASASKPLPNAYILIQIQSKQSYDVAEKNYNPFLKQGGTAMKKQININELCSHLKSCIIKT